MIEEVNKTIEKLTGVFNMLNSYNENYATLTIETAKIVELGNTLGDSIDELRRAINLMEYAMDKFGGRK
jgi:hypothetical protein